MLNKQEEFVFEDTINDVFRSTDQFLVLVGNTLC